jgi:hypothetical protein
MVKIRFTFTYINIYIIISINYGEVTMVINDIFEVLRIRKVIELLQYFLITLHTLLVQSLPHHHFIEN